MIPKLCRGGEDKAGKIKKKEGMGELH